MANIDKLLGVLQKNNGSDLHISPSNPPLIRISGELSPVGHAKITTGQTKMMMY